MFLPRSRTTNFLVKALENFQGFCLIMHLKDVMQFLPKSLKVWYTYSLKSFPRSLQGMVKNSPGHLVGVSS